MSPVDTICDLLRSVELTLEDKWRIKEALTGRKREFEWRATCDPCGQTISSWRHERPNSIACMRCGRENSPDEVLPLLAR